MKVPFLLCAVLVGVCARPVRAQAPDGQALYREHCRTCHGVTGKPTDRARHEYKRVPTFADPAFFAHRSQDSVVAVLTNGASSSKDMKSFKDKLTHDEMVAVAHYIRTFATAAPASP